MKKLLLTTVAMLAFSAPALACAPAPSCWIEAGPAYLKTICRGYAKDHRTVAEIATYLDEPEKTQDFVKACSKLGVTFKPGGVDRP
jgi:hypothetical protein